MKPDTHQQQQTSDLLSELNSLFSIVLKQSNEKRLVQPLLNSLCTLSPNFFQHNSDWSQCLQLAALSDLPLDELTYTFELISKNEIEHDVSGCIKSFLSRKLNQQDFSDFLRFLRQMQDYKQIDWAFLLKKLKTTSGSSLPYMELGNIPQYYQTKDSVNALCRYLLAYPEYATSMTHGQLDSKQWLCQEVEKVWGKKFGNLFILAGWTGSLAQMFFDQDFQFDSVRSIDMDEKACKASEILNQLQVQNNWKFKSCHININSLEYPATLNLRKNNGEIQAVVEMPELIINTSCEHMDGDSWWQKIPLGTKVVLQSNNGFHIHEHVNCSKSLDEFISKMKLSRLHFAGEKTMPEFHRYMIIGEK